MKKFFTTAAFFWACTFTQQAQDIDGASNKNSLWLSNERIEHNDLIYGIDKDVYDS